MKKGEPVAIGRYVEGKYHVKTIRRGFQQSADDYHATVTRISDDEQIILTSEWKWVMKLMTRRATLDRYFKRMDKRKQKLQETEEEVV